MKKNPVPQRPQLPPVPVTQTQMPSRPQMDEPIMRPARRASRPALNFSEHVEIENGRVRISEALGAIIILVVSALYLLGIIK